MSGRRAQAGWLHAAQRSAVSLAECGICGLRAISRHAGPKETQKHPCRAQESRTGRHRVPACAGRRSHAGRLALFKRCYDRTYAEHYSTPYLNLEFFLRIGATMPQNILLVIGERAGRPVSASLLIHTEQTLYGRYWGAVEYHSCLHFETAYYQPLEFCIAQRIARFEGGAQGEHKMARGFLPQKTWSAHWLAHPAFADAIERFLARENGGIEAYIDELNERNPFRSGDGK